MRYRGGVTLLSVCLCLAGCSLFGKKSGTPAAKAPSDPPPPQLNSTPDRTPATTVSNNGVLAGQIVDSYNHRPSNMFIRVVDLEDLREPRPAPIEVQANEQGYFTISGLRPGAQYQLIARGQEGQRTLAGNLIAKPPNPRLTIWVGEDPTPDPGPPAAQPATPGRVADTGTTPAAALGAPIKGSAAGQAPADPRPADSPAATGSNPAPPPAGPVPVSPDPTRTANDDSVKDGFQRVQPAPAASIPGQPGTKLPPPPGAPGVTEPSPPTNPAPRPQSPPQGPVSREQPEKTPVPSCQLVGRRLINLALYEENGKVWEYRKNRAGQGRVGRLVLLDFMFTSCGACRKATPKLVDLDKNYRQWGLEVVAIANESGSIEEQVKQIHGMRARYQMWYPVLLASGPRCPVLTQFDIQAYPTVILLDENGDIVYRSRNGVDDREYRELAFEIDRRLISRR